MPGVLNLQAAEYSSGSNQDSLEREWMTILLLTAYTKSVTKLDSLALTSEYGLQIRNLFQASIDQLTPSLMTSPQQ